MKDNVNQQFNMKAYSKSTFELYHARTQNHKFKDKHRLFLRKESVNKLKVSRYNCGSDSFDQILK